MLLLKYDDAVHVAGNPCFTMASFLNADRSCNAYSVDFGRRILIKSVAVAFPLPEC